MHSAKKDDITAVLFLAVAMLVFSPLSVANGEEPTEAQIQSWIKALQSDDYSIREWATDNLRDAGATAIEPLTKSMSGFDVESTIRGLGILQSLALQQESAAEAEHAVRQLASERATAGALRAKDTLDAVVAGKPKRAEQVLRRLGAEFEVAANPYGSSYVTVSFGRRWKGQLGDLKYLHWLTDYREIAVKAVGKPVSDSWIESFAEIPNLAELTLNTASVTDRGLAHVAKMSNLKHLRIYYLDVTDRCFEFFNAPNSELRSVYLFGTKISEAKLEKAREEQSGIVFRFGYGGFLGIAGKKYVAGEIGCEVTDVTANEAASRADIRRNDVIMEYDGNVVREFVRPEQQPRGYVPPVLPRQKEKNEAAGAPSLSELIGQNRPGDRVAVKIQRNGNIIMKEVELGRWR